MILFEVSKLLELMLYIPEKNRCIVPKIAAIH